MFSTLSDLTKIGRSILSSAILRPVQTRKWLKPRAFLSDPLNAVGAPWEILRLPTSNHKVVDMYTKFGSTPGYDSLFTLVPSWDVGFTVLSAGKQSSSTTHMLGNLVTSTLLKAIEDSAKEEAETKFAGTYRAERGNSSITLSALDSSLGIKITSFISHGKDMLTNGLLPGPEISARLFPTGIIRVLRDGKVEMGFRASLESLAEGPRGVFGMECMPWMDLDAKGTWGGVAIDDFVIVLGVHGKAISVRPRALRVNLVKSE